MRCKTCEKIQRLVEIRKELIIKNGWEWILDQDPDWLRNETKRLYIDRFGK